MIISRHVLLKYNVGLDGENNRFRGHVAKRADLYTALPFRRTFGGLKRISQRNGHKHRNEYCLTDLSAISSQDVLVAVAVVTLYPAVFNGRVDPALEIAISHLE